ncbi:uroporphyrinogen-III synthase [Paenibacillus sacheonensis]|uniref:Uroporphyrinogen-III synthase n=1 Tax=Paenibacillus sacheonensis TaxID=742054 RepID=A0A7X4YX90_9BACL|nr:uroporphyrinogen-III synthase [Paenibacillus sacheonensis]MBM7566579.1 uroporphyrinogen-III synthase [Paenibacillus sacheonensis]NBC73079.1 uroporphyrinogen-III synthase [Paenibacillus sacheonensis]
MARLEGKVVAVTGARKWDDFSRMVAKFGGTAVSRPAQGTVYLDESSIEAQLKALIARPADWLLLTTGTGTEALLESADRLGLLMPFLAALGRMRIAARGYKTVAALRRFGLAPDVRDEDGTTAGLLRAMGDCDLNGRLVVLQLYGDPAPKITSELAARGAVCEELLPYRQLPPEDGEVGLLLDEIIRGQVDAVAFTSTAQVRCVMGFAAELGKLDAVREAFAGRVLAAAVGKLSAEALHEEGVERVLFPEEERMGSMVVAIRKFFSAAAEDHVA